MMAAVSLTAALAACGVPTKSALLAEGDEVCRTSNAPVQSVEKPTSYPELAEAARAMAAAAARARAHGFTACGVDTEAPVTAVVDGARSIVKAAFVARAEGVCRQAINQGGRLRAPPRQSALVAYLDAILAIEEKVAEDLRALPVPPGDEAAVADLIAAREELNAKGRELTSAMRARDGRQQAAVADQLVVLGTAAAAKADAYGVRECGTGSILG